MRFAAIATTVAAVLVTPLALAAAAPGMSSEAFLNAARCAGYESISPASARQGWVQADLNAEARRQPAAIADTASVELSAIAQRAAAVSTPADAAYLRMEREAACAGSPGQVADVAIAGGAG